MKSGKIAIVIAAAFMFGLQPCSAAPAGSADKSGIRQRICGTLKARVNLLSRLVSDYEKQYKNGSLSGMPLLIAKTQLYKSELMMMKAEAGLAPEPGIAIAVVEFYAAAACAKELQKRFTRGNMALSTLLNAQLQANNAELKYLTLLQQCSRPEVMESVRKKMPPFDPGKKLDAKLLRELFEAELKAK